MSSPFQRSPSGDKFGGQSVGNAVAGSSVVPVYNPVTGDYEPRKLPAGGGSSSPLSSVFYVDGDTTTPLADQDGSIGAPYASLQDAIDARATDTFISTFLLVPRAATYGAISLPNGFAASIVGLGGPGNSDPPTIGDVNLGTSAFLSVEDVSTGDVSGPGNFRAFGEFACGNVNVAQFIAEGLGLADPSSTVGNVTSAQATSIIGVAISGTVNGSSDVTLYRSSANAVLSGNDLNIDLYTLSTVRVNGGSFTVTGTKNVVDAPTTVVPGGDTPPGQFHVPAFLAPGVQEITVSVPGARPGDTFAYAVSGGPGIYPANVGFGPMRCITNDQVVLEAICPTTSADNTSCDLTVTRFTVGSL